MRKERSILVSERSKTLSDGTGRPPRPQQIEMFYDMNKALESHEVYVGNAPPGIGKSFLLKAMQTQADSADIITSDNNLIAQYLTTYPELNCVKGKDRYETEGEYNLAHKRAKMGTPSIFNPLSYHFARQRGLRTPDMVLIDEAHLFVDMLTFLSAQVIPVSQTNVPENAKTEGDLIKWCYARYDRLRKACSQVDAPGALFQEFARIAQLKDTLEEGSQNQVFELSKGLVPINGKKPQKCLILTPVRVPHSLIRAVTGARRVVAVSGTATRFDAANIAAGRSFHYDQRDYLTPKENRPVFFDPVDPDLRKDPQTLADKIRKIYLANPVPTLVHVTYGQQKDLESLLNDLRPLVNNTTNKADVKRRFLDRGGLWLAAGVSEGIDLPYEACQQMIIPTLLYPDRNDLFIQKRVGLADGDYWYKLRTMQNTVQRLGRGVRAIDDRCVSFILDPTFARLHEEVGEEFAKLNVIWSRN